MGHRGFTLVELMIVVAIVIILSVVAGGAYRRYLDTARKSEVYSMFAEIRVKEEAYRAEFSTYLSTGTETAFFPALGANEPSAKAWNPAAGSAWVQLGVAPGRAQLYCGYTVIAGAAGTALAGTYGGPSFSNATPATPWWYTVGTCDNDGNNALNAIFVTTSDRDTVYEQNVHN